MCSVFQDPPPTRSAPEGQRVVQSVHQGGNLLYSIDLLEYLRYSFGTLATVSQEAQMGLKTGIQWTDATWNPMTGCTKISRGCDNCYALALALTKVREAYLRGIPIKDTPANRADPFAPRFWEARLDQPLRWREPRRIFVNSMSDVFHAHFSLDLIQRVFDVMNRARWHQFQVLTKRPERALRLSDRLTWTENIWIGTSIEDMDLASRADYVRPIPAAVRFISAEPLLGA